MLHRIILPITVACLMWAPAPAQDRKGFQRTSLRVSSTGPGSRVTVDRGKRDMVLRGDRVLLYPRNGRTYKGTVVQLTERSAVVELIDKKFVPPPVTAARCVRCSAIRAPAT